jgi:glycosyltransferase involved in cell wall biosynthesis
VAGPNNHYKKVLMIAYGFPPIAYVGTHRTLRFCRYLPDNGWLPTVITIKEDIDLHNDFNLLRKVPQEIKISRTKTIDIWRSVWKRYSLQTNGNGGGRGSRKVGMREKCRRVAQSVILNLFSIPDHMLLWVPFAVMRGIALNRSENFDIIYTTSPPHSEHLAGILLSKICKKNWVVDFRDPLLDNFCLQDIPAYQRRINSLLERIIVRNAHRIIMVSELHHKMMTERYPASQEKFIIIKNGFDPEQFGKLESCSYNKFTILYTGSFYGPIMPDFFMQGLKRWVEERGACVRNDVQALFYGFGNKRVDTLAKEMELEDIVKNYGFIPQDEIIKKQKGANLLLLILGFDEKSKGVISSKVYEYLAAGVPILAMIPEGDALRIIRAHAKYYHVPEKDYSYLRQSLDAAYADYLRRKQQPCTVIPHDHHNCLAPFNAIIQVQDLARIFNETMKNS